MYALLTPRVVQDDVYTQPLQAVDQCTSNEGLLDLFGAIQDKIQQRAVGALLRPDLTGA